MKTIKRNEIQDYKELKEGEQFIYEDGQFEFFAIKINDKYSAFINCDGKFILAQKYTNCLSIGAGFIREWDTYEKIVYYSKTNPTL